MQNVSTDLSSDLRRITDGEHDLNIGSNGGADVNVQDQTTPPVDFFFVQTIGMPTTLSVNAVIDDMSITVTDPSNFSVGNFVGLFCPDENRFYFGEVLAVTGSVIGLDTPIDFAYQSGEVTVSTTRELNVDGSGASEAFVVRGGGAGSDLSFDIVRIMVQITDDTVMDDAKFGGISALTNGIVLRRVDGETRNYFNVKSNGDFALLAFDAQYAVKAPAGFYGFRVRLTYGGQNKHGVVVRLAPGESLQLIIQDDLSGLASFRMMASGHIVQPD